MTFANKLKHGRFGSGIWPILTLSVLSVTSVATAQGRCGSPVGVDFDSAHISTVGMTAEPLIRLNEYLDKEQHEIRALLILKDCRLVFERYNDGLSRSHNHTVYSVTKSVVSTLVGALIYQGRLKEGGRSENSLDRPETSQPAKARSRSIAAHACCELADFLLRQYSFPDFGKKDSRSGTLSPAAPWPHRPQSVHLPGPPPGPG